MGSGQSAVRATHFSRPDSDEAMVPELGDSDDQHISISNKMVERLVEDATLSVCAEAAATAVASVVKPPKQDYKEVMFIDKLKALDDTHSERTGLTVEEMRSIHKRIEKRTATAGDMQDVCPSAAAAVVACYNSDEEPRDVLKCWDTVFEFSKCVQESSGQRLHSRAVRDALEQARLTRQVAQARGRALKDIKHETPTPS